MARQQEVAAAIAKAVKDFDEELVLVGLCNSFSVMQAKAVELKTASEAFADRSYQDDGTLTPRSQANALIVDQDKMLQQVLQIILQKTVTTVSGKNISMHADTICIHGDGPNAVEFAKTIYHTLKQNNIAIKSF